MLYKYDKRTHNMLGRFYFHFSLVFYKLFSGCFNNTVISLALVGYEMIIANSPPRFLLSLSLISYPMRGRGIIGYYFRSQSKKSHFQSSTDVNFFINFRLLVKGQSDQRHNLNTLTKEKLSDLLHLLIVSSKENVDFELDRKHSAA